MSETILTANHLYFSYKSFLNRNPKNSILKDLSLTVKKGACVGIIGANGSGKSTLFSILAGIRTQSSGDYSVLSSIGYVPQENPLLPELTVQDNLKLWYAGTPYQLSEDLHSDILAPLALEPMLRTPVAKLSGGMKKRVSIAIALSNHPSILLLDEPSAALDLICKHEITDYLTAFKQQGGTILFTTHEESELAICTELYVLSDGALQRIPTTTRGTDLLAYLH